MGILLSKPRWSCAPLLALALGDRIHTSNLDAAFKAMSLRPLATQPKKSRGPIRHKEDILIAVILQETLNPQQCLTSKSQKCRSSTEKINIYIWACHCKSVQAPPSAGFYHLLLLSLFFFFFYITWNKIILSSFQLPKKTFCSWLRLLTHLFYWKQLLEQVHNAMDQTRRNSSLAPELPLSWEYFLTNI